MISGRRWPQARVSASAGLADEAGQRAASVCRRRSWSTRTLSAAHARSHAAAPARREASFDIRFGFGIDELGALFEAAEQCDVIERKGSYYYIGAEKLSQVRAGWCPVSVGRG